MFQEALTIITKGLFVALLLMVGTSVTAKNKDKGQIFPIIFSLALLTLILII